MKPNCTYVVLVKDGIEYLWLSPAGKPWDFPPALCHNVIEFGVNKMTSNEDVLTVATLQEIVAMGCGIPIPYDMEYVVHPPPFFTPMFIH